MKFENTKLSNWFENLSGVFVLFLPVDFLGSLLNLCELKMLCPDCVDNILLLTYALNTRYAYLGTRDSVLLDILTIKLLLLQIVINHFRISTVTCI